MNGFSTYRFVRDVFNCVAIGCAVFVLGYAFGCGVGYGLSRGFWAAQMEASQ